jgi:hypothetical protein
MIKLVLFSTMLAAQFRAIAAMPKTDHSRTAPTVTVADNDCEPFPQPCGGACAGGCPGSAS